MKRKPRKKYGYSINTAMERSNQREKKMGDWTPAEAGERNTSEKAVEGALMPGKAHRGKRN